MKHKLKTSFILKQSKMNKMGYAPIILRITVDGQQLNLSTGIYISPNTWDTSKSQVKGKAPLSINQNKKLHQLINDVYEAEAQLVSSRSLISADTIKNKLKGVDELGKTLMQVFDYQLDQMQNLIGVDYEKSTIDKFKFIRTHVKEFINHHYKRSDIYLQELRYNFITEYEYYLKTQKGQAQVTSNKSIQRLRQVVKFAVINDWLDKDPFLAYKAKPTIKVVEFLSKDELLILETSNFIQPRLELVKDLFVFSCYTGLAYHELNSLTKDDIRTDLDEDRWIVTYRKKTDRTYKVPLLPHAEQIISKYANHPLKLYGGKLLPVISNQKLNSYLKEIADILGIKITLTHHIARKTFATTVLLSNGVSMDITKELLGHSSVTITEKYYGKILQSKLNEDMKILRGKLCDNSHEESNIKSKVIMYANS